MAKHGKTRISLILLVLLCGCGSQKDEQAAVARIDGQTLTLADVKAELDSTRGITRAQMQEYVQRWMNNEILYREALRRGIDKSEQIAKRVEESRRQLIISALLEEEIYNEKTSTTTPQEVSDYFTAHRNEFTLTQDIVLVSYVLFTDRDASNSFRNTILTGSTWHQAMESFIKTSGQARFIAGHVDSVYFNQYTLLPVELWRMATNMRVGEPSFPVKTNDGYFILMVWKIVRQGQPADENYAAPEIRNRLAMQRRQRLLNAMMENLRSQHSIQILLRPPEQDSSQGKVPQ
ncbi:MAG: peptidylprolyl isomerase [bacterium]